MGERRTAYLFITAGAVGTLVATGSYYDKYVNQTNESERIAQAARQEVDAKYPPIDPNLLREASTKRFAVSTVVAEHMTKGDFAKAREVIDVTALTLAQRTLDDEETRKQAFSDTLARMTPQGNRLRVALTEVGIGVSAPLGALPLAIGLMMLSVIGLRRAPG